ncbi:MAG: outer membrane lipoprotein carrier protein LolA [Rhizobacter sp.]|nr:outer membrane lipoprotein carrier protein LolA [Rhizobacter sp.]
MRAERRRAIAASLAAFSLGCASALAPLAAGAAAAFDLETLTAQLAKVRSGEATFVETRRIEMLDRTLTSSGRLAFKAPDVFVRETLRPRHEKLAVDGNTLTMSVGERSRTLQLDASPEAAVIVEAIRGTLTGNRAALERLFETRVGGDASAWTLDLVPRDLRLRGQVASVGISGRGSVVREVRVLLADGDRSVMTIEPVATGRGGS